MPDGFLNCVVTSPPYFGLRDYGNDEQFGLEETPEAYVHNLVDLFREIRRALRDDGTVWLNLGDSYFSTTKGTGGPSDKQDSNAGSRYNPIKLKSSYGIKPKDLIGIPWRVAFALQSDGWYLRQDIIWHKPNPMPESVTDRCTKSHEYIFLLTKSAKYYYDSEAVKEKASNEGRVISLGEKSFSRGQATGMGIEPSGNGRSEQYTVPNGRNKRSVWTVTTKPYSEAHFATYPEDLIKPCILAGCPENGIVYDPFGGAGTTALVSHKARRKWILSELNPEYVKIAEKRLHPYITQTTLF